MNWNSFFSIMTKVLMVLPSAVQTVELFAKHKDSLTKQEMAHAAVVAASGISEVFTNPEQKQLASAVTAVVNKGIDLTVETANVVGLFTHDKPTDPAPAKAAEVPVLTPAVKAAAAQAPAVIPSPGLHNVVPA